MKYLYTAVFTPTEDGTEFCARVPDLPGCVTTGDSLADAIAQITDAASGWLVVAEDKGLPIPAPTDPEAFPREPGSILSIVQVDTIAYRCKTSAPRSLLADTNRILSAFAEDYRRMADGDTMSEEYNIPELNPRANPYINDGKQQTSPTREEASPQVSSDEDENTTRVVMNLNHNTDADILQHLRTVPSKQGYIKSLIRADMARAGQTTRGMTKRQARLLEDMKALLEK